MKLFSIFLFSFSAMAQGPEEPGKFLPSDVQGLYISVSEHSMKLAGFLPGSLEEKTLEWALLSLTQTQVPGLLVMGTTEDRADVLINITTSGLLYTDANYKRQIEVTGDPAPRVYSVPYFGPYGDFFELRVVWDNIFKVKDGLEISDRPDAQWLLLRDLAVEIHGRIAYLERQQRLLLATQRSDNLESWRYLWQVTESLSHRKAVGFLYNYLRGPLFNGILSEEDRPRVVDKVLDLINRSEQISKDCRDQFMLP
jgi:hypothetical protein